MVNEHEFLSAYPGFGGDRISLCNSAPNFPQKVSARQAAPIAVARYDAALFSPIPCSMKAFQMNILLIFDYVFCSRTFLACTTSKVCIYKKLLKKTLIDSVVVLEFVSRRSEVFTNPAFATQVLS
jgi:hypothetical protein